MLSKWFSQLFAFVCFAAVVFAALPPGYEDELYCPPGSCLRRKEMPSGWCGPRSAMHECVNDVSGEFVSKPTPWGKNIDPAVKEELLTKGHHSNVCKDSTPKGPSAKNAGLPKGLGGLMQVSEAEGAPSFMKPRRLGGAAYDAAPALCSPFMTLRSA